MLPAFFDFFTAVFPGTKRAWNTGCLGASRPVSFMQAFFSSGIVPPKSKSLGLPRFFDSLARNASVAFSSTLPLDLITTP